MSEILLSLSGMTCAACAARIEKKLNKLPEVTATVNFATEKAQVEFPDSWDYHETAQKLVAVVADAGYQAQPVIASSGLGDPAINIPWRIYLAGMLGVIVVLLAMVPALQFPGWQWLSGILTVPVWLIAAWPIHLATWKNLRHGVLTMDTLITLSTTAALLYSGYALTGPAGNLGYQHKFHFGLTQITHADIYFEAVCAIIIFVSLGREIEHRARNSATSAITEINRLAPEKVLVKQKISEADAQLHANDSGLDNKGYQEQSLNTLQIGDIFLARAGDTLASDGIVVSGKTTLNLATLTGESVPVLVQTGDEVLAGAVVLDGQLEVQATTLAAESYLGRLAQLVEKAQTKKSQVQRLADKVSAIFVPVVTGIAILASLIWWFVGQPYLGIQVFVTVLIIACPCALGLATPTALLVASAQGASQGIVIHGPEVLERVRKIQKIYFDKTGTLTQGQPKPTAVYDFSSGSSVSYNLDDLTEKTKYLLGLVAAAESGSLHPLAKAIVQKFTPIGEIQDLENLAGLGILARVVDNSKSYQIAVGNRDLFQERQLPFPRVAFESRDNKDPETKVFVSIVGAMDKQILASSTADNSEKTLSVVDNSYLLLTFRDELRPSAATAVQSFQAQGITPVILTGDIAGTELAQELGIQEIYTSCKPEDKVRIIREAQEIGIQVAMIGDGVNDVAAISQSDVGIALNQGTNATKAAADITLVNLSISTAVKAIELSQKTLKIIHGNLGWAFGYNIVAIPVAAFGLLNPMIAGGAMAFSSVFVVLNSLRIRRIFRKDQSSFETAPR